MFTVTGNYNLQGIKVLVTRPRHQAASLADAIEKAGGEAIIFPVIDIRPTPLAQWQLPDWYHVDWVIFVSSNAVLYFNEQLSPVVGNAIRYAAVGAGTAKAMRQAGLTVDLAPAEKVGSEGLLNQPQWQDMQGQHVVIVRGKGGRELLADTLRARGATISYMEVYERCLPVVRHEQCEQALTADCVLCTSVAGVDNLCTLLGDACNRLLDKPLIVLSDRIRQHAVELGFKHVFVTKDASDKALMMQLTEMETRS